MAGQAGFEDLGCVEKGPLCMGANFKFKPT